MPKRVKGTWLPDHEQQLIDLLAADGTYQISKLNAGLASTEQFRRAVDVGAHVGTWSRVLARSFAVVDAFEPIGSHAECFRLNMVEHPNVTLHEFALGNHAGMIDLMPHRSSSAKSRVATADPTIKKHKYDRDVQAAIRTLDSFELENVDFLKIDCEGFEYFVLRGGEQTIKRDRPCIIVEQKAGNGSKYGLGDYDAITLLRSWGAAIVEEINGDFIMRWK